MNQTDDRFGIEKGKIYQIVVFQAERHTTESNYRLTLANFVGGKSLCTPTCGDGVVVRGEVCDDGEDGNGVIDVSDLLVLLANWGPCPTGSCAADLNDDGSIDVSDLLMLLGNWG